MRASALIGLRCPGTGTETNPIFIAAVIYAGDLVVGPVALSRAANVVRIASRTVHAVAFVNFYFAITVRSVDITVRVGTLWLGLRPIN